MHEVSLMASREGAHVERRVVATSLSTIQQALVARRALFMLITTNSSGHVNPCYVWRALRDGRFKAEPERCRQACLSRFRQYMAY